VAKDELDNLLAHQHLGRRVPVLFLANKTDLPNALAPVELAQVGTSGMIGSCAIIIRNMTAAMDARASTQLAV